MNNWHIWGLILGLLFGPFMASPSYASAQVPYSQDKPKNPPLGKTSKRIKVTLPQKKTPEQEQKEKELLIAEEMGMQYAWMYAATLPGLGQAYNAQYWKIPFIYAFFAVLGWGGIYNHNEYVRTKQAMIGKNQADYRDLAEVDAFRKSRDTFFALGVLWYLANIFDAYVSASLKTFDISSDIGPRFKPSVTPPTAHNAPSIGISLAWNLLNDYSGGSGHRQKTRLR